VPEVAYTTVVHAPQMAIWDFVKVMDNWAPYVTGYQSHEVIDDADSIWTLKGDVGVLSRVVQFRVHITEWAGPARVAFTMSGLNEQTEGEGLFVMGPVTGEIETSSAPAAPRRGWWRSLRSRMILFFYRRSNPQQTERIVSQTGPAASQLAFTLRMKSGGVIGPVVDAMIEPMLAPAAEDLANKIANQVERLAAQGVPTGG
jgi:carbon monoxide dehydrogenase subunit G